MRTQTLVSLFSHIPVERGDLIERPDNMATMVFSELSCGYAYLSFPGAVKAGRLSMSLNGAALAFVDQDLVVPRPSAGPIDHRLHRIIPK